MLWILLLSSVNLANSLGTKGFELKISNDGILESVISLNNNEKRLNLSRLELRGVLPEAFDHVREIKSLDLSNNEIKILPESVFAKLANLEQLSLANNSKPIKLTKHFSSLNKLKSLDLSSSPLTFNPDTFSGLSDNTEIKFPTSFSSLQPTIFNVDTSLQMGEKNLSHANCSGTFPDSFYKTIEQSIYMYDENNYDRNTTLCLSNNKVVETVGIANENCAVVYFLSEYLFLSNKSIESFKKNWYRLADEYKIVELYLENNNIREIDENILNDLPEPLYYVDMSGNKITNVKNNVMKNDKIKSIDLSGNEIATIEDEAFKWMASLIFLGLIRNNISDLLFLKSIPSTIISLELANNNISTIPDGVFTHMTNLHYLDLSMNRIKFLNDKTFIGLSHLNHLYLDANEIAKIEKGQFDYLPCALVLSLTGNNIGLVEKGFARNMNNLEYLIIDTTMAVTKFERGLFYGLPLNCTVKTPTNPKSIEPGIFKNYE